MLQGAIVGAVIGLVVSVVYLVMHRGWQRSIFAKLREAGPAAARTALDRRVAPTGKIGLTKLLDYQGRMALLSYIGNLDQLEKEARDITSGAAAKAQVAAIAWLGLAYRQDDPRAAIAELERTAHEVETEASKVQRLLVDRVRSLLALGRAQAPGASLSADDQRKLERQNRDQLPATKSLVYDAIARAIEQSGGDGSAHRKKAASIRGE